MADGNERRQVLITASAQIGLMALSGCAPVGLQSDQQRDADGVAQGANEIATSPLDLAPLTSGESAFAPAISAATMQLHHGKHHKAYVDALRRIEAAHPGSISKYTLRELVVLMQAAGPNARVPYQNAAQHYNHCIQWLSLSAKGGGQPSKVVADALSQRFGGVPQFQQAWLDKAVNLFGSGWLWLVYDAKSGRIEMVSTSNADTPITMPGLTVLGTIDVWEHAHYVDYPAARKAYVQAVMDKLFNWRFVEEQLLRAQQAIKPSQT